MSHLMVDSDTMARRQLLDVMGPPEMANLTPVRPTPPVHPEYAFDTPRRGVGALRANGLGLFTTTQSVAPTTTNISSTQPVHPE